MSFRLDHKYVGFTVLSFVFIVKYDPRDSVQSVVYC